MTPDSIANAAACSLVARWWCLDEPPSLTSARKQRPDPIRGWLITRHDNYATVAGIDKIVPCDVYVPGCPPRPEGVLDGLLLLMDKISRGDRSPSVVKPRTDPASLPSYPLVQLGKR